MGEEESQKEEVPVGPSEGGFVVRDGAGNRERENLAIGVDWLDWNLVRAGPPVATTRTPASPDLTRAALACPSAA